MFTTASFYHSSEWEKLLAQLKIERANEEGQIICWHCGKPITKAYDIIGHHKVELTDNNVNDFTVSLNPDNIVFVHHRCHNFIHNKLGYAKREVFLVYGAPFSGAAEWVKKNMSRGDLVIDLDSIWQCVSGCERFDKPLRLNAVVFKLRDELFNAVRYRLGKWNAAYIIGGFPLSSERLRICRELGAREVFIESTRDACVKRMEKVKGIKRDDYLKYIDDWFSKVC